MYEYIYVFCIRNLFNYLWILDAIVNFVFMQLIAKT